VSNLPGTTALAGLAWGLSNAVPMPLDFMGATGCFAHHDAVLNAGSPMLVQLPAATASAPIPNQASVVGVTFFLQSWAFVPGANALGLLTSNGLRVQIGQ
jgi:predicted metal-binding membrane protein